MNDTRIVTLDPNGFLHNSGHKVHLQTIAFEDNGQTRHVILKHNKYSGLLGQNTSTLEACFTALTNLFCLPAHTLRQDLVIANQNEIIGVCTEHAAYILSKSKAYKHNKLASSTTSLSPHNELSQHEFDEWLQTITPLNLTPEKWAQVKQNQSCQDTSQQAIARKLTELNELINQRKLESPLKFHQLKTLCHDLVKHKKKLIMDDIPPSFHADISFVHLVFEHEWLLFHSTHNRHKNIKHAKKITIIEQKKRI